MKQEITLIFGLPQMNQKTLNALVITISCTMVGVFALGELRWSDHWWVLAAWFLPLLDAWPTMAKRTSRKMRSEIGGAY